MPYRYCCPDCGNELKENDIRISLANMLLAGGEDIQNSGDGLLVSKDCMRRLYSDTERPVEELMEIAFPDTYPAFRDSILERKKRIESDLSRLRTEQAKLEETSEQDDFLDDDESTAESSIQKSIESLEHSLETITEGIEFLGLSTAQKEQLWHNCLENVIVSFNEQYGYYYRYSTYGETKIGYGLMCCKYCNGGVLSDAFRKKQYVVGVVGTAAVGKSCLIAAMCDYLAETDYLKGRSGNGGQFPILVQNTPIGTDDGALSVENATKVGTKVNLFKAAMAAYRKGRPLRNTDKMGVNCVNPTVIRNTDIWTFVDVAGEAIRDPNNQLLDANTITRNFRSILMCDAYLFCVGSDRPGDAPANNAIHDFLGILDQERKYSPVMLIETKVDEISDEMLNHKNAAMHGRRPWIQQEYKYAGESAHVIQEMIGAYSMLSKDNYCTAITASAYGFSPVGEDVEMPPRPRNIDMIIDWIMMVSGDLDVTRQNSRPVRCDGMTLRRSCRENERLYSELHLKEDELFYIGRLFSNPHKAETEYYRTMKTGLSGAIISFFLKLKYRKRRKYYND